MTPNSGDLLIRFRPIPAAELTRRAPTDREAVNYARHELTNYDDLVEENPDRRNEIARRVLLLIANHYPALLTEALSQIDGLGASGEAYARKQEARRASEERSINERMEEEVVLNLNTGALETAPLAASEPRWYFGEEVFRIILATIEPLRDVMPAEQQRRWVDGFAVERFPWHEIAIWELIRGAVGGFNQAPHRRAAAAIMVQVSFALSNGLPSRARVGVPSGSPLYHRGQRVADNFLKEYRSDAFRERLAELERMIRADNRGRTPVS